MKLMTPIFNDSKLQEQFEKDGFVVVPFLNEAEVNTLSSLFYKLHKQVPENFYSTTFSASPELKEEINEQTNRVFGSKTDQLFGNIKKLGSSFLCKAPGEGGKMHVHQDWTVVDESKFCSVTVWVPLVDTSEKNGAIRVLRGSHRFTDTLRAPTLPSEYAGLQNEIWDEMELLPMKAGEAFIFNHALLHASSVNKTDKERLAITYGVIPAEAGLMLYHLNENKKLEKYLMPDDMFQRYHNIGQRPEFGEKVEELSYEVKPMSSLKLHSLINKGIRSRIMKPLFKDAAVQKFFDEEGYAKLPVLNADEVQLLLDYYKSLQLKDEAGFGFHISMDVKDKALVPKILEKIYEVALPKVSAHFENAKPFVGSFVIKEPNPMGVVPVHQDWTFVEDEDQHCSVTCWVPLVDTTLDNGALGVVRGSHNFFRNYRPSPSPQVPSPISEHMFTIFPYLKLIEMKAGEALIFDNRTFHGSPPNASDSARIAFGIGFTQSDAQLCHFYLKPDGNKNKILKYKIDGSFFYKYENPGLAKMYDKGEVIEGFETVEELPFNLPKFTVDELVDLIKENDNEFNVPMCEKLAKLFSYNMDGSKKADTQNQQTEPEQAAPVEPINTPYVWVDERSFFQKYTPLNVVREIKKRLQADKN
jgi:ectoine hydroxylase-related dioxygenase (phytanoyl-CoA dioxygenase family)